MIPNMKLSKKYTFRSRKVLLIILDGVGYSPKGPEFGNAIAGAKLPFLNRVWNQFPTLHLQAHGKAVGMPSDDDMGNSEVGHNVLGSGRIFDQGAKLVSNSIASGDIFNGQAWKEVIGNSKKNNSTLHLLGLFSDGNVHSHIDHTKALILRAILEKVPKIRLHILLDGRDVPEKSALDYLNPFETWLDSLRKDGTDIRIASGGGRMTITMDRYEADWSMVERGWKVHVKGEGRYFSSAKEAIETFRSEDPKIIDQYLPSFVISDNGKPVGKIQDGDSVVFTNFRGDRAIEISLAFTEKNFDKFDRGPLPNVLYAGIMQYDGDLKLPERFLVAPPAIDRTLGEYMANSNIPQYALSETQKYGHVTYFWNGNKSGYFDQNSEEYREILSDVIPFDQSPEMKALLITEALEKALNENKQDFYRVNYANGDMVGHTGNYPATVQAMEFLDGCVERLWKICEKQNIVLLITADHGNADEMFQLDKKGNVERDSHGNPIPKTSHTLNPVPISVLDPENKIRFRSNLSNPGLANVAATILDVMGYETPEGYSSSLIENEP
ncbi:2,3-bisphosphoglycerate-independent phosphoglycerate mutase [Leptospira kirschneri str. 200801925]|uniref:2,3-bisphosphoglycerate-independent phosphoglycerate mutase n=2 Tax=Leptospira kirschneri TaxID=29507 RepID=A0A828Y5R0_9LEPT|nr:2,3-bisphosphoglycerate-independent phosphoglycerate mutase [Leptospira kirschneri serovar Grippotyphosa str. RM52]EKO52572.1 2,3-bisphosphoglycerate-independent phosphoglycerate mutase [Leptospira kirschneri str. 200802841]EKQ83022.1 2,3-bisphosphoglycerate-independent phosphoglycerate mutase [Leptospira kirschneri serovar Grippotyphosa str. Moskva]EKR09611.1 2,3-bisphosphoglycerate-independent phosphoglycerate mutase [Leptospira kirschneri serovar Valbuzzi str. 200702274]EMK02683.1 2,3-bis